MDCVQILFGAHDVFESLAVLFALIPCFLGLHYMNEAIKNQWRTVTESSRAMYVDVLKTMITASGIVFALMTSSTFQSLKGNPLLWCIAKFVVVCLMLCTIFSLVVILALSRGYERALARRIKALNDADNSDELKKQLLEKLKKPEELKGCTGLKDLMEKVADAVTKQYKSSVPRGELNNIELGFILVPGSIALSLFLIGFLNLGLIIWNL